MKELFAIVIFFYSLSTAGYVAFFFIQKDIFQRVGFYALLAGFGIHCAHIGWLWVDSGLVPVRNLHETLSVAGWSVSGVFLLLRQKYKLKILGIYAAPLALAIMICAAQVPDQPVLTPNTVLNSIWVLIHVMAIFIGEAAFALACGAGALYLVQEHAIKNKQTGFFFKRLPSLELLDTTGYACIVVGFSLLTFGLISGFVYAKAVWGRFWTWDAKEVWSMISWLIYAALLHQRLTIGWRGRRAAYMAIVGFAALLFTFLGVNFLLQGHHNEFTRW